MFKGPSIPVLHCPANLKECNVDLQRLFNSSLWAIQPERLALLIEQIRTKAFDLSWSAAKPNTYGVRKHKITVIPVQGVLTKDGPAWLGSTYESIADAAEQAGSDPDVKQLILDVDSPGGEVTGLPETAAVLAQVSKIKPVSAIVGGMSASAAYWLTSQARNITATPSGEVGSVGVRMMHVDMSKMLEDAGYKITELYSGNFKTEWSPYKPLSDEAKADMQNRLTGIHSDFINAVAEGRGVRATADTKADRFGEGRMFSATDAMNKGLVDKIQPPREFYRAIIPVQEQEASAPAFGFPKNKGASVVSAFVAACVEHRALSVEANADLSAYIEAIFTAGRDPAFMRARLQRLMLNAARP